MTLLLLLALARAGEQQHRSKMMNRYASETSVTLQQTKMK
jgi:hypothetical protein